MAYANKDDYKKWYRANRERLIAKANGEQAIDDSGDNFF